MLHHFITPQCCCHSIIYCLAIVLPFFSFIYTAFSIFFLVTEKDTIDECHLWLYTLLYLLFSFSFSSLTPKYPIFLITWTLLNTFLCIFGGTQLWTDQCSSLFHTDFYIFGVITFVIQCVSFMILPLGLCYFYWKKKETTNVESVITV